MKIESKRVIILFLEGVSYLMQIYSLPRYFKIDYHFGTSRIIINSLTRIIIP
jgi:hypothetical protein